LFNSACVTFVRRDALAIKYEVPTFKVMHAYEVRPRKHKRVVDLISDLLPFGRLWYGEPNAVRHAISYAKFLQPVTRRCDSRFR
jgi:hypothetical protein